MSASLLGEDDYPPAATLDDPDGHARHAFLDINTTTEDVPYRLV